MQNAINFIKEHNMRSLIPHTNHKQQVSYAERIRLVFERTTDVKIQYHGERKFFLNQETQKHGYYMLQKLQDTMEGKYHETLQRAINTIERARQMHFFNALACAQRGVA